MPAERVSSARKPAVCPQSRVSVYCAVAAVAIALGLHIQPTIAISGSELRVSLADLVAPLMLPLVILIWWRKWKMVDPRLLFICLAGAAAATIVMSYGFAIGASRLGGVQAWALIKYLGWFVLLFYSVLGASLALAGSKWVVRHFVQTFVGIHVLLLIAYLAAESSGIGWPGPKHARMSGLISNPNAYGLALLCAIALVLPMKQCFQARFRGFWWEALLGLLCAGVLFTTSIGTMIGLAVILVLFLFFSGQIASALRILICAAMIYITPATINSLSVNPDPGGSQDSMDVAVLKKLRHPDPRNFDVRKDTFYKAIELWREAPWFGIGLGSFISTVRNPIPGTGIVIQIHNTAIWLLAEFGIVGAVIFGLLFLVSIGFLLRMMNQFREHDPPRADLLFSGLMIMAGWGAMSLAHELMYQRVPWFILGLCAGVVLSAERNVTKQA